MNLYTVMLVDDEEEVRQAIIRKLEWNEIGFQVTGYAENGEEALEKAEILRPDVVMTDIKMPFMDGLTLCRKIREKLPHTKLIIFSGFDEFEYAKEAIKLEVEEYVLKPIDATELKSVFERIKIQLDKEVNEKRDIEKLKRYYKDSLPVMREQFLVNLIEGKIKEDRIKELIKNYDMEMDSPFYTVGIIYTDSGLKLEETDTDFLPSPELSSLSILQITDETLRSSFRFRCLIYLDSVIVIGFLKSQNENIEFIDLIDQVCKWGKRVLGYDTSAGIGQVCDNIKDINHSYKGAKSALDYRILLEPNQAIHILDIEPQSVNEILDEHVIERIIREIKLGEVEDLTREIDELIFSLKNSKISLSQYHVSIMEMITEILKLGRAYQLDMGELLGGDFNIYQEIYKINSLEKFKQWLLSCALKIRNGIRRERMDSTKLLAEKAMQYIKEHFNESDLSVDTLCSHLNVSSAYFSTIFKRETGMSYIMYLTKIRMERALHLLNTTEDKTYIISEKVGYMEPNYFSYVFKKEYGISPSKYRASRVENNEK